MFVFMFANHSWYTNILPFSSYWTVCKQSSKNNNIKSQSMTNIIILWILCLSIIAILSGIYLCLWMTIFILHGVSKFSRFFCCPLSHFITLFSPISVITVHGSRTLKISAGPDKEWLLRVCFEIWVIRILCNLLNDLWKWFKILNKNKIITIIVNNHS